MGNETASRRGKATHTLVEQYLKGEPQTIRDVLLLVCSDF